MVRHRIDHWNVLRQGKPGRRFRDRYDRNQRSRSGRNWLWRIVRFVSAALAFVVGVILVFLPGPAIVFFLLAGGLLASDLLWVARLMDWFEVKGRVIGRRVEAIWNRLSLLGRLAIAAVGVSLSAISTWGFYCLTH